MKSGKYKNHDKFAILKQNLFVESTKECLTMHTEMFYFNLALTTYEFFIDKHVGLVWSHKTLST